MNQEEARESRQRYGKGVSQEEARESRQRHGKGAGQEDPGESHHILPGVLESVRDEPSHSQDNSHFGRWSPGGLPKFQRAIARVKPQCIVAFFISLKRS